MFYFFGADFADYAVAFDRINRIFLLYLKFPEEITNERSATPRREAFVGKGYRNGDVWGFFQRFCFL